MDRPKHSIEGIIAVADYLILGLNVNDNQVALPQIERFFMEAKPDDPNRDPNSNREMLLRKYGEFVIDPFLDLDLPYTEACWKLYAAKENGTVSLPPAGPPPRPEVSDHTGALKLCSSSRSIAATASKSTPNASTVRGTQSCESAACSRRTSLT